MIAITIHISPYPKQVFMISDTMINKHGNKTRNK